MHAFLPKTLTTMTFLALLTTVPAHGTGHTTTTTNPLDQFEAVTANPAQGYSGSCEDIADQVIETHKQRNGGVAGDRMTGYYNLQETEPTETMLMVCEGIGEFEFGKDKPVRVFVVADSAGILYYDGYPILGDSTQTDLPAVSHATLNPTERSSPTWKQVAWQGGIPTNLHQWPPVMRAWWNAQN